MALQLGSNLDTLRAQAANALYTAASELFIHRVKDADVQDWPTDEARNEWMSRVAKQAHDDAAILIETISKKSVKIERLLKDEN